MSDVVLGSKSFESLLAELKGNPGKNDDKGATVAEMSEASGHSAKWVLERLKALHKRGKLVVGQRRSTRLDGRSCLLPVYRIK